MKEISQNLYNLKDNALKTTNYFLVSVSNRQNLELCMKYGSAGFTDSINGLWTFLDISVGDYISFLYGARVKNLYRVVKKVAYKNYKSLPPWPPVTFKMSGNTYYFPFRLYLKPERILDEPMIRAEFAYVAENLLLRGGYRKTHFQADSITFHNVSNMGERFEGSLEDIEFNQDTFIPKIVFKRELQRVPEFFYFRELILQSLLRKKLGTYGFLNHVIEYFDMENTPEDFEVLGEKALPEGYVDIFIKLRHPIAANKYILVEVKTNKAQRRDFEQLQGYISEFGREAAGGILIARDFPKRFSFPERILPVRYHFKSLNKERAYTYENLLQNLSLEIM